MRELGRSCKSQLSTASGLTPLQSTHAVRRSYHVSLYSVLGSDTTHPQELGTGNTTVDTHVDVPPGNGSVADEAKGISKLTRRRRGENSPISPHP
jgi:hypothetical protein